MRAWAMTRHVGALVAAGAVVTGCLDAAPSSVAPSPTRRPEPTPVVTTYEPGASVWYEGLVLRVDTVTSTLDVRGGPVDVLLTVDNPSADPAELQATIFLRVGGALIEPTRDSRIPPIPAESQIMGAMRYELQAVSSVADAGVQVGDAPNHVGYVPLTAAGGAVVSLEPREFELTGTATAGELQITLRRGVQRWDLPDWSEELGADRQAISVTFDATFIGGFSGGYPFNAGANIALRLPDGTDAAPRADGHSRPVELIGPGRTKRALTTRFEIPASVTGPVSLVVLDGDKEAVIPLVIPG